MKHFPIQYELSWMLNKDKCYGNMFGMSIKNGLEYGYVSNFATKLYNSQNLPRKS